MMRSKLAVAVAIVASLTTSALAAPVAPSAAGLKAPAVLSLVPGKARVTTDVRKKNDIFGLPLILVLAAAAAVTAVVVVATNGNGSP